MSGKLYRGSAQDGAKPSDRFVYTGEKRPPRAGEWYLSGAIVCAYRAKHDMSTPYHIARKVQGFSG